MAPDIAALFQQAHPFLMSLPRVGAAFLVLPLFPATIVPRMVRAGIAIVFVLANYPMFAQDSSGLSWDIGRWMGFILKEGFIGGLIGYAMGLLLWAIGAMGALIDNQAGYANAQIFDPFGGHSQGPLSVLLMQIGLFLFICYGGFQVFLQLLFESWSLWPAGSFTPTLSHASREISINHSATMLELTARFCAPAIGVLLMIELGVGLLSRLAPQIDSYFFAMSLKGLAAMLMVAIMVSHLLDVFTQQVGLSRGLLQLFDAAWR